MVTITKGNNIKGAALYKVLVRCLYRGNGKPVLTMSTSTGSGLGRILNMGMRAALNSIHRRVTHTRLTGRGPVPAKVSGTSCTRVHFRSTLMRSSSFSLLIVNEARKGNYCYCIGNLLRARLTGCRGGCPCVIMSGRTKVRRVDENILPDVRATVLIDSYSEENMRTMNEVTRLVGRYSVRPSAINLVVGQTPGKRLGGKVRRRVTGRKLALLNIIPRSRAICRCSYRKHPADALPRSGPIGATLHTVISGLGLWSAPLIK